MRYRKKFAIVAAAVLIFLTATCSATDFDSCENCHPNEYNDWKASAHFQFTDSSGKPSIDSCFKCHSSSNINSLYSS